MDIAVAAYVFPSVLPVVAAAAACMMVVTSLSSVSLPVAKGLMIENAFWMLPMYPRLPAVLWRDITVKRLLNACG